MGLTYKAHIKSKIFCGGEKRRNIEMLQSRVVMARMIWRAEEENIFLPPKSSSSSSSSLYKFRNVFRYFTTHSKKKRESAIIRYQPKKKKSKKNFAGTESDNHRDLWIALFDYFLDSCYDANRFSVSSFLNLRFNDFSSKISELC